MGADHVGERGKNGGCLMLFVAEESDQVVVRLDRALRLEEESLTALGAIMDDPTQATPRLGTERDHVATVADGDEAVREDPVAFAVQLPLEVGDQPPPTLADIATNLRQARARLVGQRAIVVERLAQAVAQLA